MKRTIDVIPTVKELAAEFCELPAEKQVDFLVEVEARLLASGPPQRNSTVQEIGAELRTAGGYAAKLVRDLYAELEREPPEKTLDEVAHGEVAGCGTKAMTSATDGARCNRCGHYETDYERAEERYAHCPSCSRHTRWERVKAEAPPSNGTGEEKSR